MKVPDQKTIFKTMQKSGFSVLAIIRKSGLGEHYVRNRMRGLVQTPLTDEDQQKLWDAIPDKSVDND